MQGIWYLMGEILNTPAPPPLIISLSRGKPAQLHLRIHPFHGSKGACIPSVRFENEDASGKGRGSQHVSDPSREGNRSDGGDQRSLQGTRVVNYGIVLTAL